MKFGLEWDIAGFCGMGLHLKLDGFRLIYVGIAVLMWAISWVFSAEYMAHYKNKTGYYVFFWITFLATAGVFLSADLYTTFIFFEIMSFTSFAWVLFDGKKESIRAAKTYLSVAVIGGLVMLMGLFLLYDLLGTLAIDELKEKAQTAIQTGGQAQLYAAGGCLLFGFGAKAGCFPLHIWLPKAHPVAPAPASALLSGILTKTGVFGIIVLSCQIFGKDPWWGLLMVGLGFITMFLGALLAMFSINLKRTLACSSVSQMGFILTGTGMYSMLAAAGENPMLAARGVFLHMINHSLFKLTLFLCAGGVFMNLHQLDLNEIRGFGRKKPVLAFCFAMGALGISGVPLWSGYVSKTLLHESIVEYSHLAAQGLSPLRGAAGSPLLWMGAEWLFLLTGGMTVSYMLKLFIAIFVEKHPERQIEFDQKKPCMKPASGMALLIPGALIPILGLFPSQTMDRLADMGQAFFGIAELGHSIHYFTVGNLKGGGISILMGILLYVLVIRRFLMVENREPAAISIYLDRWPGFLDLENRLYRPILLIFLPGACGAVFGWLDRYFIQAFLSIFLAISAVVCRGMDHLADSMIVLARYTTHRPLGEKIARPTSARAERFRKQEKAIFRLGSQVEESFSFGLMLFGIGLCLTLGYLLYEFFHL